VITVTRQQLGSATSQRTHSRDEQAVARFVEQSAATLADMGFARMPARVAADCSTNRATACSSRG